VVAELMPGASVQIEGNGTGFSYSMPGPGEPIITVLGLNSAVTRAVSAAPLVPAPGPEAPAVAAIPGEPPGSPPMPATDLPPTVPVLMHNLGGQVVAAGTVVALQADMLFDGNSAVLHDAAAGRLTPLVQLIRQIDPAGLLITTADASDADLARRRATVLRDWFSVAGQVKLPIDTADATGAPGVSVLIRRR